MGNFFEQFDPPPQAAPPAQAPNFFQQFDQPTSDALHQGMTHQPQVNIDLPGQTNSAFRGAVDTGFLGFGDEAAAALRVKPFEGDLGGQYNANLDRIRAMQDAAKQAHPATFAAGQVGGAVLPMLVPGGAGVRAGAGLAENAVRGAVTSGVLGGVYGAGSGNGDVGAMAKGAGEGAGLGFIAGGAVPLVGRGIGNAWRTAAGMGAESRAAALGARAAVSDNLPTAADLQRALAGHGPDTMIADLGPNLQRQAGALAASPGEAQRIVRDALVARQQGANARIQTGVDTNFGPATIPSQVDAGIVTSQRMLGPQYDAALANARAVNTTAIANDLDAQAVNLRGPAQAAVRSVRDMLNVAGTAHLDPNPATLLQTRQAIDGMLAGQTDGNVVRALTQARRGVDDALTVAVPGIKDVDARYAELARQREALARGQTVLDSGRTSPRPPELAQEIATGAIPQGTMFGPSGVPTQLRAGARAEIDRIIGTKTNDVVALQGLIKGEGSWNRDRLATLFGQDRADAVIRILDRERLYADTANTVMRNSETRARQLATEEINPTGEGAAGVARSLMNFKPGDAAARAVEIATGGVSATHRGASNAELARILTATPATGAATPAIQAIVDSLLRQQRQNGVERGANLALTPLIRGGVDAFQR